MRNARLQDVFCADQNRQLNANFARLCVLYEDLRLELCGIVAPSIPALDILDSEEDNKCAHREQTGGYRLYYFVRRSIGTIREFAEALRMISVDHDFQRYCTSFAAENKATWDKAIAFFETNESLLKVIRNDIGGHFGHQAALNALDHLRPDTTSFIEVVDGSEMRLHFAGEIAACALLRHLPNNDVREYEALLKDCIKPAYKHAARSVQILVVECLWTRFGK
jgi:hypothetical protein